MPQSLLSTPFPFLKEVGNVTRAYATATLLSIRRSLSSLSVSSSSSIVKREGRAFSRHRTVTTTSNDSSINDNTSSITTDDAEEQLTHLNASGEVRMVHIPPPPSPSSSSSSIPTSSASTPPDSESSGPVSTTKAVTARTAIARAHVLFSNSKPLSLIRSAALAKGDVLSVARIAGIMASKKTSDIIPLCHNIPLSGVEVDARMVIPPAPSPPRQQQQQLPIGADASSSSAPSILKNSKYKEKGEELGREAGDEGEEYVADAQVSKFGAIAITAKVHTFGQTGVEMEALTAASAAALTVYDMCKGVDRGMRIEGLRVVLKEGGRSGTWVEAKSK